MNISEKYPQRVNIKTYKRHTRSGEVKWIRHHSRLINKFPHPKYITWMMVDGEKRVVEVTIGKGGFRKFRVLDDKRLAKQISFDQARNRFEQLSKKRQELDKQRRSKNTFSKDNISSKYLSKEGPQRFDVDGLDTPKPREMTSEEIKSDKRQTVGLITRFEHELDDPKLTDAKRKEIKEKIKGLEHTLTILNSKVPKGDWKEEWKKSGEFGKKQRKTRTDRTNEAIQKEYNFIAMSYLGKDEMTDNDRSYKIKWQIEELNKLKNQIGYDKETLDKEIKKKEDEYVDLEHKMASLEQQKKNMEKKSRKEEIVDKIKKNLEKAKLTRKRIDEETEKHGKELKENEIALIKSNNDQERATVDNRFYDIKKDFDKIFSELGKERSEEITEHEKLINDLQEIEGKELTERKERMKEKREGTIEEDTKKLEKMQETIVKNTKDKWLRELWKERKVQETGDDNTIGIIDPSNIIMLTTERQFDESTLDRMTKNKKKIKFDPEKARFSFTEGIGLYEFDKKKKCGYITEYVDPIIKLFKNPEVYYEPNKPLIVKGDGFVYAIAPRVYEEGLIEEGWSFDESETPKPEKKKKRTRGITLSKKEYEKIKKKYTIEELNQLANIEPSKRHKNRDNLISDVLSRLRSKDKNDQTENEAIKKRLKLKGKVNGYWNNIKETNLGTGITSDDNVAFMGYIKEFDSSNFYNNEFKHYRKLDYSNSMLMFETHRDRRNKKKDKFYSYLLSSNQEESYRKDLIDEAINNFQDPEIYIADGRPLIVKSKDKVMVIAPRMTDEKPDPDKIIPKKEYDRLSKLKLDELKKKSDSDVKSKELLILNVYRKEHFPEEYQKTRNEKRELREKQEKEMLKNQALEEEYKKSKQEQEEKEWKNLSEWRFLPHEKRLDILDKISEDETVVNLNNSIRQITERFQREDSNIAYAYQKDLPQDIKDKYRKNLKDAELDFKKTKEQLKKREDLLKIQLTKELLKKTNKG